MIRPTEEQRAHFESQGISVVRRLAENAGYPLQVQQAAFQWLADKEEEASRLNEASQAEQMKVARSAKDAAWAASAAAERAAAAAEAQAKAANEQARIAKMALTTARIATAIAAIALVVSIVAALHIGR